MLVNLQTIIATCVIASVRVNTKLASGSCLLSIS